MAPPRSAVQQLELRPLFGKRIRAAKVSFYLGVCFFLSAFVGFAYGMLAGLPIATPVAAILGFFVGFYFFLLGLVWSSLWALLVQLHALFEDLAAWVAEALTAMTAALRAQFVSGVVIDLTVIETQIDTLVGTQAERWAGAENPIVPMVRQWAPPVAKAGLKIAVMRVAGNVWHNDTQITVDTLEHGLDRLSLASASRSIRRTLWVITLAWAAAGLILTGAPFACAALLRAIFG